MPPNKFNKNWKKRVTEKQVSELFFKKFKDPLVHDPSKLYFVLGKASPPECLKLGGFSFKNLCYLCSDWLRPLNSYKIPSLLNVWK